MFRLVILGVVVMAVSSCQPKDLPTKFVNEENKVEVYLSHMSTKAEMDNITAELAKKSVKVDFGRSTFFEDGKLRILDLSASCGGATGHCHIDLVGLQYHYHGMRCDMKGGFAVGSMD
jgi:hypothetical protein